MKDLMKIAEEFSQGNFHNRANVTTSDEISLLAETLNTMGDQLSNLIEGLENQVLIRTYGLQISAEIGRRLSTILDKNELILAVITQLRDAFNYYHVHIYLMNPNHKFLRIS